jgi:hypothetical protein
MKRVLTLLLSAVVAIPNALFGQDVISHSPTPAATTLNGRWIFTSSVTGRGYRGDIQVKLGPADARGVQVGKISYDGQQTNDRCSTKSGFSSDKPVDVEAIRKGERYFLKFFLNCPIGESPRLFELELVKGAENVWTMDRSAGHGIGLISLKEVP